MKEETDIDGIKVIYCIKGCLSTFTCLTYNEVPFGLGCFFFSDAVLREII